MKMFVTIRASLQCFCRNRAVSCLVPDVSLPMDNATDHVVKGSMSGAMTSGAALVAAQVGNGLYTDGQTGHANYGNHYTECCHIPDMCAQGVTFALWIKRGIGASKGIVLHTGGFERNSKGKQKENIRSQISLLYGQWCTALLSGIPTRWQYICGRANNSNTLEFHSENIQCRGIWWWATLGWCYSIATLRLSSTIPEWFIVKYHMNTLLSNGRV